MEAKIEEQPKAPEEEKKHDVDYTDPEADEAKEKLPDVKLATGTEGEDCIFKMRIKLFRFRDNQWKERGIGNAKLLRNNEQKRVRFVMR